MEFSTLEAIWDNLSYGIEEDLPDIGVYLYCYNIAGKCIYDYLQNSIDECKIFAYEEFGVPIDSWREKK